MNQRNIKKGKIKINLNQRKNFEKVEWAKLQYIKNTRNSGDYKSSILILK